MVRLDLTTRTIDPAMPRNELDRLQAHAERLMHLGRVAEGAALFKQVADARPDEPSLQFGWLWNLQYLPGTDRAFFAEQVRRWAPRVFDVQPWNRFAVEPDPERRLRLGWVGGHFIHNSILSPFEVIVDRLDRDRFECVFYGHVPRPDEATDRWRRRGLYRDVSRLGDEQVALAVVDDQIDILLEVGGACRGNRLGVFAYRPAPVQVDLGALATLGLPVIDYHVTDPVLDPPEVQWAYDETLAYLSPSVPFVPPTPCPEVRQTPTPADGAVTLGVFNNHRKFTDEMLGLWAEILRRLPRAGLVIKTPEAADPAVRAVLWDRFGSCGLPLDRLQLVGSTGFTEHLHWLGRCDLLLDTFPYNAARGTMEALWMGVPTVTRCGQVPVARVGRMILEQVGLGLFVAESEDQYIDKAVSFARQGPELTALRRALRDRVRRSPLGDVIGWTRRFEDLLRSFWRRWCDSPEARGRNRR